MMLNKFEGDFNKKREKSGIVDGNNPNDQCAYKNSNKRNDYGEPHSLLTVEELFDNVSFLITHEKHNHMEIRDANLYCIYNLLKLCSSSFVQYKYQSNWLIFPAA